MSFRGKCNRPAAGSTDPSLPSVLPSPCLAGGPRHPGQAAAPWSRWVTSLSLERPRSGGGSRETGAGPGSLLELVPCTRHCCHRSRPVRQTPPVLETVGWFSDRHELGCRTESLPAAALLSTCFSGPPFLLSWSLSSQACLPVTNLVSPCLYLLLGPLSFPSTSPVVLPQPQLSALAGLLRRRSPRG